MEVSVSVANSHAVTKHTQRKTCFWHLRKRSKHLKSRNIRIQKLFCNISLHVKNSSEQKIVEESGIYHYKRNHKLLRLLILHVKKVVVLCYILF